MSSSVKRIRSTTIASTLNKLMHSLGMDADAEKRIAIVGGARRCLLCRESNCAEVNPDLEVLDLRASASTPVASKIFQAADAATPHDWSGNATDGRRNILEVKMYSCRCFTAARRKSDTGKLV